MRVRLLLAAFCLGVLSLGLFLFRIGHPPVYLIDEGGYVQEARAFLSGLPDANPEHPPLAKILIAGGMKLFGDNPFGWRFASALFGSLTLVAIFFWTYLLLQDLGLSVAAALLSLFDNFLYVMSRIAMLDVFYFAFVMLGILAFTGAILSESLSPARRRGLVVCAGVMFGLGTACKWNAIVSLGAIVLLSAGLLLAGRYHLSEIGWGTILSGLIALPVVVYCLAYLPLCAEIHQPYTLRGLVRMNVYIWRWHVHCPGNPMLNVPVRDWFFRASPQRVMSWLMGNFVVAWGGIAALMICIWRLCKYRTAAIAETMIVVLYTVNVFQWIVIPQKMTCYYYYYPPVIFLGIAIVVAISRLRTRTIAGINISLLIVIAAFVFFLYCFPRMADLQAPFDCALGCWS